MNTVININEFVECELTEYGKKAISQRGFKPDFKTGTNIIKIQLWQLMNNLGDSIFNGAEQCIAGNKIIIHHNKLKKENYTISKEILTKVLAALENNYFYNDRNNDEVIEAHWKLQHEIEKQDN